MKNNKELLIEANSIIRSFKSVIDRQGKETNWEGLDIQVTRILKEQHTELSQLEAEPEERERPEKSAEEMRMDFYGKDDARTYDYDELYLMKEYASQSSPVKENPNGNEVPIDVNFLLTNAIRHLDNEQLKSLADSIYERIPNKGNVTEEMILKVLQNGIYYSDVDVSVNEPIESIAKELYSLFQGEKVTEITDEEIEMAAYDFKNSIGSVRYNKEAVHDFKKGAKWLRDKIKQNGK
jgi:hypothetical protein